MCGVSLYSMSEDSKKYFRVANGKVKNISNVKGIELVTNLSSASVIYLHQ